MRSAFLTIGCVFVGALSTQTQGVRFDVASIKPNTAGPTSMLWAFRGRRFTARYVTLKQLTSTAYGQVEHSLAAYQLSGGPDWLDADRFDVEATAPGVPDSPRGTFPSPLLAMLRSLLEERFQLQTHFEAKELPVFALVLARRDGTLGPRLRRRTVDCVAAGAETREPRNLFNPALAERRPCGGRMGLGLLTAGGLTMTNLASALESRVPGVDRVVVDRTGLAGTFDVDVTWRFETPADASAGLLPPPDPNAPTLFTALQEQLGLKLESTKAPVDILVIDRVEHPTEN
jgi:uncharacterized protein (TIGR03435 family)